MGTRQSCAAGFGAYWWRSALATGWRTTALCGLTLTAPTPLWAKRPVPASLPAQSFDLQSRAVPLQLTTLSAASARPETGLEPARSLVPESSGVQGAASRLLSIREDLRFVINGRVKDTRRERMTLGLHFARRF